MLFIDNFIAYPVCVYIKKLNVETLLETLKLKKAFRRKNQNRMISIKLIILIQNIDTGIGTGTSGLL